MKKLISMTIPTIILAHSYELNTPEYDKVLDTLSKVAKKYRREIFFMHGTDKSKFTQLFTESYRLYKKDFPALCMSSTTDESQESIEKYKKLFNGVMPTVEDLESFIDDWKSMSLSPYISSEEIPKIPVDENGIYKLVGDTFKSTIEAAGRDVVLLLCSDRLDVCTKFREIYIRIAKKLKNNDNILFTEVNPYANELEFGNFDNLPGIILLPDRGDKFNNAVEFKGRLSTKEIIRFIREHTVHPILREDSLPVEEILHREEDMNEIKPMNLEQKGIARKIHEKMADPDQKELYKFPVKEESAKEQQYLENYLDLRIKEIKDEL